MSAGLCRVVLWSAQRALAIYMWIMSPVVPPLLPSDLQLTRRILIVRGWRGLSAGTWEWGADVLRSDGDWSKMNRIALWFQILESGSTVSFILSLTIYNGILQKIYLHIVTKVKYLIFLLCVILFFSKNNGVDNSNLSSFVTDIQGKPKNLCVFNCIHYRNSKRFQQISYKHFLNNFLCRFQ